MRSTVSRTVSAISLVVILVIALSSCGAGGSGGVGSAGGGNSGGSSGAGGGGGKGNVSSAGNPGEGMMEEEMLMEEGSSRSTMAQSSGSEDVASSGALPDGFDRKVVKSADIGLRVEDVRGSAARVQDVADQVGGGILNSNVNERNGGTFAELLLSVPAEEFDNVLGKLRDLPGKVTSDSVSGQDVTEEFVDLESRERNLLAAEESLLKLFEQSEIVKDTLVVERELTNVRGQIEQVQGRLKFLEGRTAFSQISVSIMPVPSPAKPDSGWQPARVVAEAWDASLAVLQAAGTAIIAILVFGWVWIPALLLGFFFWKRRSQPSPQPPEAT